MFLYGFVRDEERAKTLQLTFTNLTKVEAIVNGANSQPLVSLVYSFKVAACMHLVVALTAMLLLL